jgi:MoaA/NifB/PqqE/SkfB family radical SAM enzyme
MSKKPKSSYPLCREFLTELKPTRAWKAIEEVRKNYRLLTFGLELTRKCNLKCIYCYADAGEPAENELTLRETFDAVKQAYDLGARKFGIIGGGETLLYPYLFEVIDYIKMLGASVSIFTNTTLITRIVAKKLFDKKINIIAKYNSLNPQVQDFLTGVEGSFDRIQEGIRNLREEGYPSQDCALVLETVICRQNLKELPKLWCWIRNQGAIPFFERLTIQGRAKKYLQCLEVSPQELYRLFKKLLEIDQKEYGYTWSIQPPWTAKVCDRHFYNAFLTSEGYIQPCTGIDIHLGNIRYQKLAEILRDSPVVQALRHIDKNIKGYCKTCPMHKNNRCYGCRGTAYQITGDFLASDPYCWNNPKF